MRTYISFIFLILTVHESYGFLAAWQAATAYRQGDFANARILYEDMVTRDPLDMSPLYNLGKTAYKLHDYDCAAQCFDKVSHAEQLTNTQKEQAYFQLGDAYMHLKEYESALTAYEAAALLNPDNQHTKQRIEQAKQLLEKEKKEREQQNNANQKQLPEREKQQGDKNRQGENQQENKKQSNGDQETGQQKRADQQDVSSDMGQKGQADDTQTQESSENKHEHKQPNKADLQDNNIQDTSELYSEQVDQTSSALDAQDTEMLRAIEAAESETGKQQMQRYIQNTMPVAHGHKNW